MKVENEMQNYNFLLPSLSISNVDRLVDRWSDTGAEDVACLEGADMHFTWYTQDIARACIHA